MHKFSQDIRRDGIEYFTYTRIPLLLLLTYLHLNDMANDIVQKQTEQIEKKHLFFSFSYGYNIQVSIYYFLKISELISYCVNIKIAKI